LSDDIRYKILPGIHEIPVAKRHGLHEAEDKVSKLITRLPETLGFTATSVVAKKGFVGLIPDKDTSKVILSEQRRVFNVLHIRLLPPNLEPLFITRRYMNEAAATTVVEALAHDMQIHPELFHITLGSLTVQAKTPKKP